jgi:lysozyme family protein
MKTVVIAAVATLLFASGAHAGELKFPSDAPVASVTFPDDWTSAKETETGIDASSPDDSIYIAIDVADAKDTDAVVNDAVTYLGGQGVNVDSTTAKESEGTLNGMKVFNVDWDGTDKDGPVSISLAAVVVNAEKVLVVTYWGTKGEQDKNAAAMNMIVNSLKPAG